MNNPLIYKKLCDLISNQNEIVTKLNDIANNLKITRTYVSTCFENKLDNILTQGFIEIIVDNENNTKTINYIDSNGTILNKDNYLLSTCCH